MLHQLQEQVCIAFQMQQRSDNFLLSLLVDLEIEFGARLGMTSLEVLTNHYERHQQYLNDVADEEVSDKSRKRIESRPVQSRYFRRQDVVSRPQHSPCCDDRKEAH